MTDHTLLPCPFCGGEAEIWRASADPKRPAWVGCMGRCAVLVSREYETTEEAIAAWNRRTPPAVPDGWVMVPREPTDEMTDKGESALIAGPLEKEFKDAPSATWAAAKACYRAMISAAPAAPTETSDE